VIADDQPATVTLRIVRNATNQSVFDTTVTVAADNNRKFDVPFPAPGNYTIRATLDGTTHTMVWDVQRVEPSYAVLVSVRDGTVSFVAETS